MAALLSLLNSTLFGAGIILLYLIFVIISNVFFSPLRNLPGPWYTVWTRLRLKLSIITGQRLHYIHALHQKYGPIVRIAPTEVAVADLAGLQEIYKTSPGFPKAAWYGDMLPTPTPAIFNVRSPKDHAARRKLFARPFSKTNLRTEWEGSIREKVKLAVAGIAKQAQQFGQADIFKWWTFLAVDVSGHLNFGESFHTLETGKKSEYIALLEWVLMGSGISYELPFARLLGYLPVPILQRLFNSIDRIHDFAEKAVESAHSSRTDRNIFATIVAEAEKDDGVIDDVVVRTEAGHLIIAGTDTTAVTMTYLTWCVLRNPSLREALVEEIRALPESFTDADMEKLPLLNATVEEALRLYGAAPGSLPREVPTGGVKLNAHFIPAGITVSMQSWTLNRDPGIWDEPERFNPYRFLPPSEKISMASTRSQPKSAIAAFGAGARTCLGMHLAWMELRYGLVYFLKECPSLILSPSATAESMKPENFFLIAPQSHECMVIQR